MAYNSILVLISKNDLSVDAYGDRVITETRKQVFCECASIGMKEFYEANALGFQPEIRFRIADYLDYNNQNTVEFENTRYRVLRNYRVGQVVELTCAREVNDA